MLSDELTVLLPRFVDQRGPSHDELSRLIQRVGLADADPLRGVNYFCRSRAADLIVAAHPRNDDANAGKVKRVRAILAYAIDREPTKGERFVELFVEQVRACGGSGRDRRIARERIRLTL